MTLSGDHHKRTSPKPRLTGLRLIHCAGCSLRPAPLIGRRQQLDILQGREAVKPLNGVPALVELAGLKILLNQPLNLDRRKAVLKEACVEGE